MFVIVDNLDRMTYNLTDRFSDLEEFAFALWITEMILVVTDMTMQCQEFFRNAESFKTIFNIKKCNDVTLY